LTIIDGDILESSNIIYREKRCDMYAAVGVINEGTCTESGGPEKAEENAPEIQCCGALKKAGL